jgi:hypothetical protein
MTTQLAPHRMDLPPPSQLDLLDMGRVVGWIDGSRVGFLGFADEREVASAAWLAYRTMSRRLARRLRIRPIPVDTEPLALAKHGNREVILASGRPIATLLRPGRDSRSGPHAFGFTVNLPPPADELTVRSMAYSIYRTLRKSGLPWALWARDTSSLTAESPSPAKEAIMSRPRGYGAAVRAPQPVITVATASVMATLALFTMIALFVAAPSAVTVPIGVVLAIGLAATTVLMVGERRRKNDPRRMSRPNVGRSSVEGPLVPGWDELGVLSAVILVVAFLVPAELGLGLLAVGLAGLFIFRIAMMYQR